MVGTPASQLVDFVSAGVHEASELAPPSSGAPSPSEEDQWASSHLGSAQDILSCLHHHNLGSPKGGYSAGDVPSNGPLSGH